MGQSIDFIKDRRVKTISAATTFADAWVWEEQDLPTMQAELAALAGDGSFTGQEELAAAAEAAMLAARGAWDTQLDVLHRRTVQGVGMAKNKFRDDPAKLQNLSGLTARGTSRTETLAEALAWESAWEKAAPAWAPLPANTLAAFKTLRTACLDALQKAYSDQRAAWRDEAEKLAQMALVMENRSEAWYAAATLVYPAGTPEGDMIRGTVPTTYTPPPPAPPAPPTPPAPTGP